MLAPTGPHTPIRTCSFPRVTQTALSLLQASPPATVLDVGCYVGDISRQLSAKGFKVSSMDHHAYPGTELLADFHLVDASKDWPFGVDHFDAVICTEVIEHVDSPRNLLKEAARVLRPGGELILSTPNVSSLVSRFSFLLTGHLVQFGCHEFHEWGHITPVTPDWIVWQSLRCNLVPSNVTAEIPQHGWKRRLAWHGCRLLKPLFRSQTAALLEGHSVIFRLVKTQ